MVLEHRMCIYLVLTPSHVRWLPMFLRLLEGHPDKVCDQVSDAGLDACLAADPKSKLLVRQATNDNMMIVAGEIKTQANLDYEKMIRE